MFLEIVGCRIPDRGRKNAGLDTPKSTCQMSAVSALVANFWWLPAVLRESNARFRKSVDSVTFWCPRPSKVRRLSHFRAVHKIGNQESNNSLAFWHTWPLTVATVLHIDGVRKFDEQKNTDAIAPMSS